MPRSYAIQASRSAFFAATRSSGDAGLMNCSMVGLVCCAAEELATIASRNAPSAWQRFVVMASLKANGRWRKSETADSGPLQVAVASISVVCLLTSDVRVSSDSVTCESAAVYTGLPLDGV